MPAVFYEDNVRTGLKHKRLLSSFLDNLIHQHKSDLKKVQLNYVFCTDAHLLEMNMQYLAHDTLTDIITFDLSEVPYSLKGEIYISIDRVKENAIKYNTIYSDELLRVIFHGALHLCGFKDKTKIESKLMREMEDECISVYSKKTGK